MRIVDLSHSFRPGHWRWNPILRHTSTHAEGATFQSGSLQTPLHAFTHVDAPAHFLPDGRSIDQLPVDAWVGEATVVDLSSLELGHGHGVLAEHLEMGARHVRQGDIVLLRTDWDRRCDVSTDRFWREGPFTTRPAAEWLATRGVKAVGYDYPPDECLTLDPLDSGRLPREQHTTHDVFFPRGILVVEYLANLADLRAERFLFAALPLNLVGGDGCPVRAIAIEGLV